MALAQEQSGVRTVARFRPPNEREKRLGYDPKLSPFVLERPGTIRVKDPQARADALYTVTKVFGHQCTQKEVFEAAAGDAVRDLFQGFNGTVFAYGQTGAGKSHSMFGAVGDPEQQGIIPRAVGAIFGFIYASNSNAEYKLSCSYLEIYKEELRDLLAVQKKPLHIRQSPQKGIFVEDLHYEYVGSESDVYDCLHVGNEQRKVGRTNMNSVSSRSHCVFTVYVEQHDADGTTKQAKFNMVDLAGSEKVRKSGATGETLEEAKKINLSLTCLSQCIHALSNGGGKTHVPFRTSKLTRLLQESLGGNSKTTLLVACSPSPDNVDETVATLRFAERCMTIKNDVRANVHLSAEQLTAMVTSLSAELAQLKAHTTAMEGQLRAAGVEIKGSLHSEGARHQDVSMQFPEHAQLYPHDLRSNADARPGRGHRSVKSMVSVFEPQPNGSGVDEESAGRPNANIAANHSAAPDTVRVSVPVTILGCPRDHFTDTAREAFVAAVWGTVAHLGVEKDSVFVAAVEQVDNGALTVHPVVVCGAPLVSEVVAALKAGFLSGVIVKALQLHGMELNMERVEVEVEEGGNANDAPLPDGHQGEEVVVQPALVAERSERGVLDNLLQQQVEDRAELDALRAAVERLTKEKKGLADELEVRQVAVDSTKERLVAANTRLLADNNASARRGSDHAVGERQRRGTDVEGLKPPVAKRAAARPMSSREPEEADDFDMAKKKKGLFEWRRKQAAIKAKEDKAQEEAPDSDEERLMAPVAFLAQSDHDSDEERDGVGELKGGRPSALLEGMVGIPSLELSSVSSIGGLASLVGMPVNEEIAAPRRREDEELDDLMQEQEDLAKTVRRQQGLIERQADALQLVNQRVNDAENELVDIVQERDTLQEQLQRLELKLMKHGLVQRRASVALMNPPSSRQVERPFPHDNALQSGSQMEDESRLARARGVQFNPASVPALDSVRSSAKTLGERTVSNLSSNRFSGGYDTFRDVSRFSLRAGGQSAREAANLPPPDGNPSFLDKPMPPPAHPHSLSHRDVGVRASGRIVLPSQRDAVRGGLASVREGPLIHKPMRAHNNSAVERARANKEDSVFGGLFQASQYLTGLFWDDDKDKGGNSGNEEDNDNGNDNGRGNGNGPPPKQSSFFGF